MKKARGFLIMFFFTFILTACGGSSSSSSSGSSSSDSSTPAEREREREDLREGGHKFVPIESVAIVQNAEGVAVRIEGYLPDSCHGPPQNKLVRDGNSFFVDVYSKVSGEFCAEVIEEFEIMVELGELASGDYEVVVQEFTRWETIETFRVD